MYLFIVVLLYSYGNSSDRKEERFAFRKRKERSLLITPTNRNTFSAELTTCSKIFWFWICKISFSTEVRSVTLNAPLNAPVLILFDFCALRYLM